MLQIKYILIFVTLLLIGCGQAEVLTIPTQQEFCPPPIKDTIIEYRDTDVKVIAYVGNDKYFCECIGKDCPCIRTDEILSELG